MNDLFTLEMIISTYAENEKIRDRFVFASSKFSKVELECEIYDMYFNKCLI